ncbi:flavodoxin FldB [Thalassotalea ponticola]|uniref:flavodoxin FldB n=1 Tax=Thalassotalea ponticola TaxID=1523392 RepID=UPI0025B58F3C|nr:flavodoxin FldB [Thalassotalea ponticola]MDN3651873.1 flavodoxin FldB [Thalassotalea ponticola]
MKIGLFYGSTTCYTEMAAEKIQATLGADLVDIHNIKDIPLNQCEQYDILIFGISTWDFGELQEDWESKWDDAAALNLNGKVVALFGLGDQEGYGQWFQDALGMLHDVVISCGAEIIGYWPNQGYQFSDSKALTDDSEYFVGLALDDETQYNHTDERIGQWCEQILGELQQILDEN